jgi:hypothetical protein
MRMTDHDRTETEIDAMFASARSLDPVPGDDLMARILADARRMQPAPQPVVVASRRRSFWQELVAAIGGWPALGGMAAATMAGLWIGFSSPAGLSGFTTLFLGETLAVPVYADDDFLLLLES